LSGEEPFHVAAFELGKKKNKTPPPPPVIQNIYL